MAEFIEHFQEVTDVSGYPVEGGDQYNIKTMPAAICKKLVESGTFGHEFHWFEKRVANYVASSAPEQAQKSREVTKLKGLNTNKLGNINSIRNRQVASSTLALGSSFFPDSSIS